MEEVERDRRSACVCEINVNGDVLGIVDQLKYLGGVLDKNN